MIWALKKASKEPLKTTFRHSEVRIGGNNWQLNYSLLQAWIQSSVWPELTRWKLWGSCLWKNLESRWLSTWREVSSWQNMRCLTWRKPRGTWFSSLPFAVRRQYACFFIICHTYAAYFPAPKMANHGIGKAAQASLVKWCQVAKKSANFLLLYKFRHLAREEAQRGIRVNSISPGFVFTKANVEAFASVKLDSRQKYYFRIFSITMTSEPLGCKLLKTWWPLCILWRSPYCPRTLRNWPFSWSTTTPADSSPASITPSTEEPQPLEDSSWRREIPSAIYLSTTSFCQWNVSLRDLFRATCKQILSRPIYLLQIGDISKIPFTCTPCLDANSKFSKSSNLPSAFHQNALAVINQLNQFSANFLPPSPKIQIPQWNPGPRWPS